ncbi:prepilin-type N-terminal cleavage/methylation domain-containing protein [Haloferula sp.]|uniref:prepilin-type N-terminal cleavage/methylation domain-containing protein n=1 Tax=Haloferula sp. TaxID=2497595 RepID=UPI003C76F6B6
MKRPKQRSRAGFTLVELLVVILIITILLTIGAAGFRNAGGKGVSTALPSTEAIFDEARSVAVGKGTRSRVLIDVDDPDSESNYLRRMFVVYEETDDNGEPIENSWKLASKAYIFPPKTYFSRVYSKKNHRAGSGELENMTLSGVSGLYNSDGDGYLYYEFNAEGICTTGLTGTDYNAPSFVIGNGARARGSLEPRTTSDGRRDFGGFVIWRNGATSVFRNPTQIIGSESPTEF